jgi:GNAT superfamily N-acetyltransferase
MIARLDSTAINDLREALPLFTHLPLAHLPHLSPDQRRAYWLDEIRQSLAEETSIAFGWLVSGRISGFIIYNESPWDSRIIGRRTGTVNHLAVTRDEPAGVEILRELTSQLVQTLADRGMQLVVCKAQSSELAAINALEQSGFLLMDTLLDFVFDFSRASIEEIAAGREDQALKIRPAKAADLPASMAISEKVFADYFGRFHADPQMPAGAPTRVYTEWVRSAFAGWADWILVAEVDGKIAGHSVWRKTLERQDANSGGVAYCDLLVVDPEFQGRRLGTALMFDGMQIARDFVRYLVGPVHVCNYSVQRTLQNLGWRIAGARHSFHKWLEA